MGKAGLWAQGKLSGQRGGVGPHAPAQAFSYSPQETLARAQQELWVGPDSADSSRQLYCAKRTGLCGQGSSLSLPSPAVRAGAKGTVLRLGFFSCIK